MKALPLLTAMLLSLIAVTWQAKRIRKFRRKNAAVWRDMLRIFTITLAFAQINASVPAIMADFPWPEDYLEFLKQWSFIEFDLVELLGTKCMGGNFWDFRARIIVATLIPVLVVMLLVTAYKVQRARVLRSHPRDSSTVLPATRVQHACEHLFDIVDRDSSGMIEPAEFKSLMALAQPGPRPRATGGRPAGTPSMSSARPPAN